MFSTNLQGLLKIVKNLKTEKTTFRAKNAFSVNNEARPTYGGPTDKVNYRDSLAVLNNIFICFCTFFRCTMDESKGDEKVEFKQV